MISLFDLHCDTFLELYNTNQSILNSSLHISLRKTKHFKPYIQIASIWSDYKLSDDEAYKKCLDVIDYISAQNLSIVTAPSLLNNPSFILGIEDARLLNGNIKRLDTLYSKGVRVLTLNWKGISCIGGSWDTNCSLTNFGKIVVERCKELGIIIDLSHSSEETFSEVIKLSQALDFIPIASHSNSFSVCDHKRNLSDTQFLELCRLGSLAGISLASEHLGNNAGISHISRHIEHYLNLNGESNVCLGCDFDGIASLPSGIKSIEDLYELYYIFVKNFGKEITEKIFFKNAFSFFSKQLS